MRIVLDEMMPKELSSLLADHEVHHVIDLGWRNATNGQLLSLCEAEAFEVLITKDSNMPYQQNVSGRSLALVVLKPKDQTLPALL